MSPVQPTEASGGNEAAPEASVAHEADRAVTVPDVETTDAASAAPTPAPTKVEAYKPRGIRSSKNAHVAIVHVVLRFITAVFALISFAVIASNSQTLQVSAGFFRLSESFHFDDFFYFSYLLTANVIAFTYALVTLILGSVLLAQGKVYENPHFLLGVFALDQIITYLLMSASTSAATGIRAQKEDLQGAGFSDGFFSTAYAAIAFSFLAFFALAAVTIVSGYRLARTRGL